MEPDRPKITKYRTIANQDGNYFLGIEPVLLYQTMARKQKRERNSFVLDMNVLISLGIR